MGLIGVGLFSLVVVIFWVAFLVLSIYVGVLTIQFCKKGVTAMDIYLGKKPEGME